MKRKEIGFLEERNLSEMTKLVSTTFFANRRIDSVVLEALKSIEQFPRGGFLLLTFSPPSKHRYKELLNKCYVADSGIMRWCPAPGCEEAVECQVSAKKLDTIVPSVQCSCGEQFCFGCGNAAHQPAICKTVIKWLKKCEDDSETVSMPFGSSR